MNKLINDIRDELTYKYYNYYCTVFYEFINEAIYNSIKDLKINDFNNIDIDLIHKHIKENYI